jgi:hypothetical protein
MARTSTSSVKPVSPKFVDPNSVFETLCFGPFHIFPGEPATITFTHSRAKIDSLFNENAPELENIVKARIVLSRAHLIELRDVLNRVFPPTREAGE